jgi:hypothetical protein
MAARKIAFFRPQAFNSPSRLGESKDLRRPARPNGAGNRHRHALGNKEHASAAKARAGVALFWEGSATKTSEWLPLRIKQEL